MSSPFHNRVRELASLGEALASKRSELVIVYGRRGVGKSALLRKAMTDQGLPFLYYRATRRTPSLQMAELTEAARAAFPSAFLPQPFAEFGTVLEFLSYQAVQRTAAGDSTPVAVVIDELPYLADADPGLLTVLQHWWDDNKRSPNLKIFLAGSYVAFMERQVLDANAPLYNRRTGAMKLEPLDYAEAALFFPGYAPEQKMEAYAILGGMPSYLEQFDAGAAIAENVRRTVLRSNTYLAQEPDWLLLEDLRRDAVYGSILRAVAAGERKPSDIARAIGKNSAQDVAQQMSTLQEMDLLVREVPVTERRQTRARNSLYFLADNYLDFWFRYADPARSLVSQGMGDEVWTRTIAPTLGEYVSRPAFERACRQYLWRALRAKALPEDMELLDVGPWWGPGDRKNDEREIDVVGLNAGGQPILAGSCKWTTSPMDVREYAALTQDLARTGLAREGQWLALFSRAGFTPRLQEIAAAQQPSRLLLIDLAAMYAV